MKTFIAALVLVSSTAFAYELDATDALLQSLPAGNYSGRSTDGSDCSVSIQVYPGKVHAVASSKGMTKRSNIFVGAVYRANPGNRSFLATTLTMSISDSRENIFKMNAATDTTQYVVIGDVIQTNREVSESKVECIIDL